jgi:hypothetical protein
MDLERKVDLMQTWLGVSTVYSNLLKGVQLSPTSSKGRQDRVDREG